MTVWLAVAAAIAPTLAAAPEFTGAWRAQPAGPDDRAAAWTTVVLTIEGDGVRWRGLGGENEQHARFGGPPVPFDGPAEYGVVQALLISPREFELRWFKPGDEGNYVVVQRLQLAGRDQLLSTQRLIVMGRTTEHKRVLVRASAAAR